MSSKKAVISIFPDPLPSEAEVDLVFVHGIDGDWENTWRPKGLDRKIKSWPVQLGHDLLEESVTARVHTIDYPARTGGESRLITEHAGYVREELKDLETRLNVKRFVFICHSLGGLLLKQMLVDEPESGTLPQKTKAILFLGTPHKGSWTARAMRFVRLASRTLRELQPGSKGILELNDAFCDLYTRHNWQVVNVYEGKKTGKSVFKIKVVNKDSAHCGVGELSKSGIHDCHISLPKASPGDQIYRKAMEMVRGVSSLPEPVRRVLDDYLAEKLLENAPKVQTYLQRKIAAKAGTQNLTQEG